MNIGKRRGQANGQSLYMCE